MLWACRRFAVVFFVFGWLLISGKVAHSQDQSITSPTAMARPTVMPRPCGDRWPVPDNQRERGSAREANHSDKLCAELAFDRSATALPWRADVREEGSKDPVLEELKAMGEQGLIIMRGLVRASRTRRCEEIPIAALHDRRKRSPIHFENTER